MGEAVGEPSVEHLMVIANSLSDPQDAEIVRQFARERAKQARTNPHVHRVSSTRSKAR